MSKRRKTLKQRFEAIVVELFDKGLRLPEVQQEVERVYLAEAMRRCDFNQSRAAEMLGIHRNTLRRKLRRNGLL